MERNIRKAVVGRGFTMVEVLMALGLFSGLLLASWSVFSFFNRQLPGLTQEVSLHRSLRLVNAVLEKRIARGVEVQAPIPVKSGEILQFLDIDNEVITVELKNGCLQSFKKGKPETELPTANPYGLIFPINVKDVEYVNFTALSPASVMVQLRFGKAKERDAGKAMTMQEFSGSLFVVELKNAKAKL